MTKDEPFVHSGRSNAFTFEPSPRHEDVLAISSAAERLGYRMYFRDVGETTIEVQERLRNDGPSAYLDVVWIQEDVSPKAEPLAAEELVRHRVMGLAPAGELVITDPFLFTASRVKDADEYAQSVARIVSPALGDQCVLIAVVSKRASSTQVEEAVIRAIERESTEATVRVVYSEDFHDRFWIADRARGFIMGASLNKIGRKIFFLDTLSASDVAAVLAELDQSGYGQHEVGAQ